MTRLQELVSSLMLVWPLVVRRLHQLRCIPALSMKSTSGPLALWLKMTMTRGSEWSLVNDPVARASIELDARMAAGGASAASAALLIRDNAEKCARMKAARSVLEMRKAPPPGAPPRKAPPPVCPVMVVHGALVDDPVARASMELDARMAAGGASAASAALHPGAFDEEYERPFGPLAEDDDDAWERMEFGE